MRKWFIFVLVFMLLATPVGVQAQSSVKLESLSIELWAEYDQPSMLVINQFVVAKETSLPAKVTLRFPKDGNLIAVAYESNKQLVNAPFESPAQQGDWQTVTLNVESYVAYRIEYYQALGRDGDKRSFDFKWFGDYPVKAFNLSFLLPPDSKMLESTPAIPQVQLSPDSRYLVGTDAKSELSIGQSYELKIAYQRASDTLTDPNAASQVQPSEPLTAQTPGRVSVVQLPWIIGGVGLATIVFAVIFYWRSLRNGASASGQSGRMRRKKTEEPEEDGELYCHQCWTRATPGDRFCRTCGSKLRTE